MDCFDISVATYVDFPVGQRDNVFRTGRYAKRTAFTTVLVNNDGTYYFSHNVIDMC